MAIANFTDLQGAIADYLARADLTPRIPDFIANAEARFNRSLRTRDMETEAAVTLTTGAGPLPVDYLEWMSVTWTGSGRSQDLRFASVDSENWQRRYRPNGDPQLFTVRAGKLVIRPVTTGTISLVYYAKIPALSSSTATNWLLTKSPDLYLSAALAEAYIFTKDEGRTAQYLQAAQAELDKAIGESDSNKISRRSAGYNAAQADEANAEKNVL